LAWAQVANFEVLDPPIPSLFVDVALNEPHRFVDGGLLEASFAGLDCFEWRFLHDGDVLGMESHDFLLSK
jgi:hypothetical protein